MTTIELPFQIGAEMWLPANVPSLVRVVCEVYAGNGRIVVILGSGEHVSVECTACDLGLSEPRGYTEEWQSEPGATQFVIAEVVRFDDGFWYVRSTTDIQSPFTCLHATRDGALAASAVRCVQLHEDNMRSRQHKKNGIRQVGWSVKYHRSKINDLERQLEWHRAKIGSVTR